MSAKAPHDASSERLETILPLLRAATKIDGLLARGASGAEIFEVVLRMLVAFPGQASLLMSAARLLVKAGELDLAEGLIKRFAGAAEAGAGAGGLAQIAKAKGDHETALGYCLDTLSIDPTAFAHYVLLAELCFRTGRRAEGEIVLDLLQGIKLGDSELNTALASLLWRNGRAAASIPRLEASYALGNRSDAFLREFMELLTGEMIYDRLRELPDMGTPGSSLFASSNMLKGHAALASRFTQRELVSAAKQRELGPDWLSSEAVMTKVAGAMKARSALSVIRLGDGEARFLICSDARSAEVLSPAQTKAIADVVWDNWFGERFDAVAADRLADLRRRFIEAIVEADALGVTDSGRFASDSGHIGYLAFAEKMIDGLMGDRTIPRFNAMAHFEFDRVPTSLSSLLNGLDFVGVIGPHAEVAAALKRRFSIETIASYVVPGEVRLWSEAPARPHFPDVYHDILDRLSVPYPGALFLVGAGLLGKSYCHEVKRRGGVALDVGSVLDGWMGKNTRPGLTQRVEAL